MNTNLRTAVSPEGTAGSSFSRKIMETRTQTQTFFNRLNLRVIRSTEDPILGLIQSCQTSADAGHASEKDDDFSGRVPVARARQLTSEA